MTQTYDPAMTDRKARMLVQDKRFEEASLQLQAALQQGRLELAMASTRAATTAAMIDDDRIFFRELRRAALQLIAVIDKRYPTDEVKRKTPA